ncbi:MAG: peptidylprolyl isomerase [Steroidobacteraceae bacterium]
MKARPILAVWLLALGGLSPGIRAQEASTAEAEVHVVLQTTLGNIRLALDPQRAPITTANFLRYVDAKRFDGIMFYRALAVGSDGEYGLVQAGMRGDKARQFEPIAHESPAVTGISHKDGTISMARLDPGTATADFFIVIGDLVTLDGDAAANDPGYAAFGHVIDGMNIVRQILAQPRDPDAGEEDMKGQMLAQPVQIVVARRE